MIVIPPTLLLPNLWEMRESALRSLKRQCLCAISAVNGPVFSLRKRLGYSVRINLTTLVEIQVLRYVLPLEFLFAVSRT